MDAIVRNKVVVTKNDWKVISGTEILLRSAQWWRNFNKIRLDTFFSQMKTFLIHSYLRLSQLFALCMKVFAYMCVNMWNSGCVYLCVLLRTHHGCLKWTNHNFIQCNPVFWFFGKSAWPSCTVLFSHSKLHQWSSWWWWFGHSVVSNSWRPHGL